MLKDGDTLGVLEGVPGVPALDDRVNGMLEGLKAVNVKIVGKGATDCTEEKGINVAQDILTANPDVKAIYSACGPPAAGAAQAIKNAKLGRHVILVGFDFCCGEAEALAAGIEDASVAQFPAKMSELGSGRSREGDSRRKGGIADRFRGRAGHKGQHGQVQVGRPRVGGAPALTLSELTPVRGSGTTDRIAALLETGDLEFVSDGLALKRGGASAHRTRAARLAVRIRYPDLHSRNPPESPTKRRGAGRPRDGARHCKAHGYGALRIHNARRSRPNRNPLQDHRRDRGTPFDRGGERATTIGLSVGN